MVVRRCEGITISVRAGTAGRPGKSVLTKTTPEPASAGLNRSVTSAPLKKPNPRTSVVRAMVRSRRVALSIPCPFRSAYDMALASGVGDGSTTHVSVQRSLHVLHPAAFWTVGPQPAPEGAGLECGPRFKDA